MTGPPRAAAFRAQSDTETSQRLRGCCREQEFLRRQVPGGTPARRSDSDQRQRQTRFAPANRRPAPPSPDSRARRRFEKCRMSGGSRGARLRPDCRARTRHFADHCATCHANDGGGDTLIGHGLYPKPPDLRLAETQHLSDGELFWIIENGVRLTGMPAFGGSGAELGGTDASWKLVRFIRHLPQLTAGEILEMGKYNPKGPDDRQEETDEQNFLNGGAAKPAGSPVHHNH